MVWELRRALAALPTEQREVVRLQHFEGLAHKQIAAHLVVPIRTVKSRSHRAYQRLTLEVGHARDGKPPHTSSRNPMHEARR